MSSGGSSSLSSPTASITARPATPGRIIAPLSTAFSGTCTPALPGRTPRSVTDPGRPSTTASTAGARTAPGPGFSTLCCSGWTIKASSTASCGLSTPPSSAPAEPPPGRGKKADSPRRLAGPASMQLDEPQDHALGRSQGGFGTKLHLACDSRGTILAVDVTAGQRSESKVFEVVMYRARRPRRRGRKRWPANLVGDKGYSYPRIRRWLRRHHIGDVIASRNDQPRDEKFDKASYRKRNLIERVIGWFKGCRALATRYDKLAVNDVALWLVANIHFLLRKRLKWLADGLSETT